MVRALGQAPLRPIVLDTQGQSAEFLASGGTVSRQWPTRSSGRCRPRRCPRPSATYAECRDPGLDVEKLSSQTPPRGAIAISSGLSGHEDTVMGQAAVGVEADAFVRNRPSGARSTTDWKPLRQSGTSTESGPLE